MNLIDTMGIVFKGRNQQRWFESLSDREIGLSVYPDGPAMIILGIQDSVLFLLSQISWDTSALRRRFSSYRRLTLEFLSSLVYKPNHGLGFNRGLIRFRLFDIEYTYTHREMAELLGFPHILDTFIIIQEELFDMGELDYLWGSITGISNPDPNDMHSENIHNPTLRYFYKILAHTLFGKLSLMKNQPVGRDIMHHLYTIS